MTTHSKILTYTEALKDVRVLMIGATVTIALIQLCFKEPVLQLRLIELGVSPNLAGLFFALDLIGYISTSWFLGRFKNEEKDFPFIMWCSSFLAIFGLFLIGTIHLIGVPDSLYPFIFGTIVNGIAGALALNNGVATTVNYLREKLGGDHSGYGESINNTTSGIFMFYFSLGEMLGPILGSVLTTVTGSFVKGVAIVDFAMLLWTGITLYHLAGYVFFKVE